MNKSLILSLALASLGSVMSSGVKASSYYRDSATFYMNLGKEEETARKYGNAWKYYERAGNFDSANVETQLAIADVCLKMNRMGPAIKALDSAGKLRPADYDTKWRLAKLYFYYDQSAKVIEMVPALYTHVSDPKGWAYMLGKSYQSIQDYGKGIHYLNIAEKEDSTNAEIPYQIGRMYMLMENYKTSVPYYKRSLALDSTDAPTRTYELALILSTVERFDESLAMFQKAIDRGYKPRDDFYMNMAYTLSDAHKPDQAIALLKGMLERRPIDLGLLNGIADVCYHAGQFKEAIGYWDKVIAIEGQNARALYSIGRAYIKMGNEKTGQQLCDKAISLDPSLGVLKHARTMQF